MGFNIHIKGVNVEPTEIEKLQIWRTLSPLLRLIDKTHEVSCRVVMRTIKRPIRGRTYHLAVQLYIDDVAYYAIDQSPHFSRSLRTVQGDLRKQISRTYHPDTHMVEHLRKQANAQMFAQLFVS